MLGQGRRGGFWGRRGALQVLLAPPVPTGILQSIYVRQMEIQAYLNRIDYHGSLEPTAETLRALHIAHLLAVPFENLNIGLGWPIVLDQAALFEKIVLRRRGGFCYEL